ncbi:hypothetical protein EIL87_25290 [Saccharopolyspora rhizosphaerae]|uniref:NAD(+)--protein-arginine ADP-ribosyltransferase n=1 Tax=Saccharopolyspora rhizosphaerae TaxID=2492662 RepID=A0A3R8NZ41_9PSEU|nr:ADP-ribosyltransferase domain-containing protein [Saccharopolyspora rhizosphaerae]RRO12982.1 hypothetical protein EIL87_25290 [Saccharopolyspora rhizosphaerae]
MTNPLVEQQPENDDGFITKGTGDQGWAAGIGLAESVNDVSSLDEGSNWVESGLAYGGLAMEGISLAVDPIGTLLSYGLSWLIEHVQPLQEALDWFAGDPDGVAAYGKSWENVSKAVEEAAQQYRAAVKADTAEWTGAAGDAYRRTAAEKGEALAGAAKLAGTISSVVTIMGEVVSFVREFVRDLVADCVARLITYALEALAPPIASLAWVVPQAITFISQTITKIADIVTKLTRTISNVSPKLAKLAEVFGDIMKLLGEKGKAGMTTAGKVAGKLDVAGRMGDKLAEKAWKQVDETFGTDVVGRHRAKFGDPDAPDGDSSGEGASSAEGQSASSDRGSEGARSTSDTSGSSSGGSPAAERGSAPGDAGANPGRSDSTSSSGGASPAEPSSARSSADPGSSSGGSSQADSGSQARGDSGGGSSQGGSSPTSGGPGGADGGSTPESGGSPRGDAGSAPESGGYGRADTASTPDSSGSGRADAGSTPESGGSPRGDAGSTPESGGSSRADPGSAAGSGGSPRADVGSASGSSSHADSAPGGQGGSSSGGAGTHTSDVPRAPAHTSAASVDAPARPDTASPQSAPAAPRPDQPSGAAPAGGTNAPAGPPASGNGTPPPRGGHQGSGGWTGTSGHPGAARNVPAHTPRTSPPSARPAGLSPVHARSAAPRPATAPVHPAGAGAPQAPVRPSAQVQGRHVAPPRPDHLRTADSPRTPVPAQRAPEPPNSLPEQPRPEQPKVSTAESMAAETPPKDQWEATHYKASHTPRFDISPELREKLGRDLREIEANRAGLSFTKPDVSRYYGRAEWAHKRPQCSVDPHRFTVEVHGGPGGAKFRGHELDARELAEIIKGTPGYRDGTPIRLVSCETGADVPDGSRNFAQQLSEELGVEVLAPNTNAWVDNHGNIYASETRAKFDEDDSGAPHPRLDSPGEWTAYRPDGTKAVHSSPYPPGHQPEWVRHGVRAEAAHRRGLFGGRKDEDFSTDPVTGHNFSNAPPQGQFGAPPQNASPPPQQHGNLPPQQTFPQQPHGFPQQPQGPQPVAQQGGIPPQGFPQSGSGQPHPQQAAPQHLPYQGPQQPSAPRGYPQHGAPQDHPRQMGGGYPPQQPQQSGGYPPHPSAPPGKPQSPQQAAYSPPGRQQGGSTPPPQQSASSAPRQNAPQQQGFQPQQVRHPNTFPPSGPGQSWNGRPSTPSPAPGGHPPTTHSQPAHEQAPHVAAPSSTPSPPEASLPPQTPPNAAPQHPSTPAHPPPPGQASGPTPQRQGPAPASPAQQPVAAKYSPQPAETTSQPPTNSAAHQPAAPLGEDASPRWDGVGTPRSNGPIMPTSPPPKPVLDDFIPTKSGISSRSDVSASSSWKSDFDRADTSTAVKPADSQEVPEPATSASGTVLDDFDPGLPGHDPVTPGSGSEFDDFEPTGTPEPSQAPGGDSWKSDFEPEVADTTSAGIDRLNAETRFGHDPVDPDRFMERITDADYRADVETRESVQQSYARDDRGQELDRGLNEMLDRHLPRIREENPELAVKIEHMDRTELLQLHAYTQPGHYEAMNKALREQDPDALATHRDKIETMVSALNELPDEACKAHRVVGAVTPEHAAAVAAGYEPGSMIRENAFTSTSVREDPNNPGQPKSKFPGKVEFHMDLRTGKDLRFLNPRDGEAEILVPPGSSFKVTGKWFDENTGVWHIELEQVLLDDMPGGELPPAPKFDYTPPPPGAKGSIADMMAGDFG